MKPSLPALLRHGALALAIGLVLAGCSSGTDTPAPASDTPHNVTLTAAQQQRIQLVTVASSHFHPGVDTTGVVDYDQNRSTAVLAPFSGPVSRVLVSLGETVKQGQALAIVSSPDFAAAADGYRKALAAARAAAKVAATDTDLYAHHAISAREDAQAQSDAVGAQSDSDAARKALLALNVDPQVVRAIEQGHATAAQAVIRAPMAGTIVQRTITPGQLLQAGSTPCFSVANLSTVWVQAQLFGADIARVKPGDHADVTFDGKTLPGKVANVSPEVDPDTRSVIARVVVDNPGDVLKKQMYVRVHLDSAQTVSGLLLPAGAILRDDENLPFVYVQAADGSYARRPVQLGTRSGQRIQIDSGLAAGDKVVAEGGIFLRFIQTQ